MDIEGLSAATWYGVHARKPDALKTKVGLSADSRSYVLHCRAIFGHRRMNAAIRRHANAAHTSGAPDSGRAEHRRGIILALDTAQTGGDPNDELNRRLRWMEIRAKLIDPEIAS